MRTLEFSVNACFLIFIPAIGNAFSVLSDREKRRKYDLTGGTETSHSHSHTHRDWDYSHGFESDLTPEEIFNMFFGSSGFTTSMGFSLLFIVIVNQFHIACQDSYERNSTAQ